MTTQPLSKRPLRALPADVWALGLVSLLMDASSELVHSLLPVFMVSVLGASMVTIGVVEGIAEATASITKVFSGALSDRLRKRKPLVVVGYGLAALSKPLFPLATSVTWVFAARCVDRVGKGIRGAPRDALIADITPADMRGTAYGRRQALDSVGAVVGPLAAVVLMAGFANDVQAVLWMAGIPAAVAVAVFTFAVREPDQAVHGDGRRVPVTMADIGQLPWRYWRIVMLGGVFTLARFSEAFLVLRAQDVGLAIGYVPIVNDRDERRLRGWGVPGGPGSGWCWRANPAWGRPWRAGGRRSRACRSDHPDPGLPRGWLLGPPHGPHAGALRQTGRRHVHTADPRHRLRHLPPRHRRALLGASLIAGALWNAVGPPATFLAGGLFAAMATVGVIARGRLQT